MFTGNARSVMPMSSFASFYIIFILLLVIIPSENRRRALRVRAISIQRNKRKGTSFMNELVNQFIGKECTITSGSGFASYSGTVESICDNWVKLVKANGESRLINLDYVNDIKEIRKKVK